MGYLERFQNWVGNVAWPSIVNFFSGESGVNDIVVPNPTLPNDFESDDAPGARGVSRSNNNSLSGQSNVARLGQRIPQIYGQVRAFPDLLSSPLYEYIDGIQRIEQFVAFSAGAKSDLIGVEATSIQDEKIGDGDLPVYIKRYSFGDATGPTGGFYREVVTDNAISGTFFKELYTSGNAYKIPMATDTIGAVGFVVTDGEWRIRIRDGLESDRNRQCSKILIAFKYMTSGDKFSIRGVTDTALDGEYTFKAIQITSKPDPSIPANTEIEIVVDETLSSTSFISRDFYVFGENIIGETYYDPVADSFSPVGSAPPVISRLNWRNKINEDQILRMSFFTESGATYGEFSGDRVDGNTGNVVQVDGFCTVYSDGNVIDSFSFSYNANFLGAKGFTVERVINTSTFPDGLITVDIQRLPRLWGVLNGYTDNGNNSVASRAFYPAPFSENRIDWEDGFYIQQVAMYQNIAAPDISNDIVAYKILTSAGGGVRGRSPVGNYNAIYQPRVRTLTNDPLNPVGAYAYSLNFYDHFLEHCLTNGITVDEVDWQTLIGVKNQSVGVGIEPDDNQFSYTFSSNTSPIDQELQTICAAARATLTRERGKYAVRRKCIRNASRVIIGRNMLSTPQITLSPAFDKTYDGITLEFINPDTAQLDSVTYPVSAINPQRIRTAGIRNVLQAKRRAQYEWKSKQYNRFTLTVEVTHEAFDMEVLETVFIQPMTRTNTSLEIHTDWRDAVFCEMLSYEEDVLAGPYPDKITLSESFTYDDYATEQFLRVGLDRNGYSGITGIANVAAIPILSDGSEYVAGARTNVLATNLTSFAALLQEAVRTAGANQIGVKCIVANSSDGQISAYTNTNRWTLIGKQPTQNRSFQLSFVNYDPRVFEYDPY